MNPELLAIVDALMRAIPVALDTEESAIELVTHARWPAGRTCSHCGDLCTRDGIHFHCACQTPPRTIFVGTALASLRRPCVRGILLALRAMAMDHRGIGARPLAKLLGMKSHVTLWRHIHRLRELLPEVLQPTPPDAAVLVCHACEPGVVCVGARAGMHGYEGAPRGHNRRRLRAEAVKSWLTATFHGVTTKYLPLYVHEAACRADYLPRAILLLVLERLIV